MSDPRQFKDSAYSLLAEVGKALADPVRIELLEYITQAPRSVSELAELTNTSVANASHHLQALKRARLVISSKSGTHRIYSAAGPEVATLIDALSSTAERHVTQIRELTHAFFGELDCLEPLDADELLRRLRDEDAVLIDVRPVEEFETEHIPGAISVPLDELEGRLEEFSRTRTVVAYCRGPFCTFAASAVELLRDEGFDAYRFEGSVTAAKRHWQKVYREKATDEVSWYRPHLDRSLEYIEKCELPLEARVIDIGGGASTWVDDMLARGFVNVAVLDISDAAMSRARERLGAKASDVDWIDKNLLHQRFEPKSLDLWHDRAVLHFLTDSSQRSAYKNKLKRALKPGGHAVIATFAPDGPESCSGLKTRSYSAEELVAWLATDSFALVESTTDVHVTPWGSEQKFTYALLRRR
jgi:rhodanese-related sulfurtransferase